MFSRKLIEAPLALTFDDVLLQPAASAVEPDQTDISTRFSRRIPLNIPLVSAAMDTVTESSMAIALARAGGLGVIHRNMTASEECDEVRRVKQAEELMSRQGIGGVPVVDDSNVVIGIVSRRDVRAIVNRRGKEAIRAIMTPSPITATETCTMEMALETMYTNKVERLPVTDEGGRLVGIITMQDVLEKRQYPSAVRDRDGNLRVAGAVGPFDHPRAMALVEAGADALVVDCAHGHNLAVVRAVGDIKGSVGVDVVAGNIATTEAAEALIGDVDGLKVGIGPGSICTTRIVAGVGVPQITAIGAVADVAGPVDVPVIADGGVRFSGDIAKAIAAGADSVMLGSLFAGTDESPGRIVAMKGRRYKQYRGMGSLGAMTVGYSSDRYFQKKEIGQTKFVPEGVEGATPYIGRASDAIYQLIGGLRSSMGYTGSATIADLKRGGRFVRITAAGFGESHPHNILITDEAPNYRMFDQ